MATFKEANQVRVGLKMQLSCYSWYMSSGVLAAEDDYYVGITASRVDNKVKKVVPACINGVEIKLSSD